MHSSQVSTDVGDPPLHTYNESMVALLHPSLSILFPSSHSSELVLYELPGTSMHTRFVLLASNPGGHVTLMSNGILEGRRTTGSSQ